MSKPLTTLSRLNFFCYRSLLCLLGLSYAAPLLAQRSDTTDEITSFFDKRANTLQEHLSVPATDKASHKRFVDAYSPLDQGQVPAQTRELLLQRMLALAGVSAASLSSAQQTQINTALSVLGSAGTTSGEAAAALAAIGASLGLSGDAAASALQSAANESGISSTSPALAQSLANNIRAGSSALQASGAAPNTLNMAKIVPPTQVKYDSEGPIVGASTLKPPSAGALTMGDYAAGLGKAPAPTAGGTISPGTTGSLFGNRTNPIPHMALQQATGAASSALKNSGPRGSTGAGQNFNTSAHNSLYDDSTHVPRPTTLTPPPPTLVTPTPKPSDTNTVTLNEAFKFDPQVLLGGDYYAEYQARIKARASGSQQAAGPSGGGSNGQTPVSTGGSSAGAQAGGGIHESLFKKDSEKMGDACEADLHKIYGFPVGKAPENLSFDQVRDLWRKYGQRKHELRYEIAKARNEERRKRGEYVSELNLKGSVENFNPDWNPLNPIPLPVLAESSRESLEERVRARAGNKPENIRAAFNQEVDDLVADFAAPLNGLTQTNQDACIFARTYMGNPSDPNTDCGQDFAIKSAKDNSGSARNSALTNHLKIVAFLDSIRDLNSAETAVKTDIMRNKFRKEYTGRFKDGSSTPIDLIFKQDDKQEEPQAGKPGGRRQSFRIAHYLYKCPNPNTSWMAKIQDLEVQARKVLIKSCGNFVGDLMMMEPTFQNTSLPLHLGTADLCSLERKDAESVYKAPKDDEFPDFFGSKQQKLDAPQCESLLNTQKAISKILKEGEARCKQQNLKEPKSKTNEHT